MGMGQVFLSEEAPPPTHPNTIRLDTAPFASNLTNPSTLPNTPTPPQQDVKQYAAVCGPCPGAFGLERDCFHRHASPSSSCLFNRGQGWGSDHHHKGTFGSQALCLYAFVVCDCVRCGMAVWEAVLVVCV